MHVIKGNEHGAGCLCYKYAQSPQASTAFLPAFLKFFVILNLMFEQTFKLTWTEGELGGKGANPS